MDEDKFLGRKGARRESACTDSVVYMVYMGVEQGPLGRRLLGRGRKLKVRSSWALLGCGARVV